MPDMPMPGEAIMPAAMSVVMMIAMMLPVFAPVLWRYRAGIAGTSTPRRGALSALFGAGYLFVWAAISLLALPLGAALAHAPIAGAVIIVIAGLFQFTGWKAHYVACVRRSPAHAHPRGAANGVAACLEGVRFGLHCARCCGNLMAILIAIGGMDVPAMTVVTAAIASERLAPGRARVARAIGVAVVAFGLTALAKNLLHV